MKNTFWRIECEEGIRKISSMIIPVGQITDIGLEKLMRTLFAKYILTDDEILSSLCKKGSLRFKDLVCYNKFQDNDSQNILHTCYSAQSSGISILISIVYENELTSSEKEKINSSSDLNLKK